MVATFLGSVLLLKGELHGGKCRAVVVVLDNLVLLNRRCNLAAIPISSDDTSLHHVL